MYIRQFFFKFQTDFRYWSCISVLRVSNFDNLTWGFLQSFDVLDLCATGLVLIKNVPANLEGLPAFVNMIFRPEITHYDGYFKVEHRFDANNLAYTGATLGLHTDLPFYHKTPSVYHYFFLILQSNIQKTVITLSSSK